MWCRSPYIRVRRICKKQHVNSESAACIRHSLQHAVLKHNYDVYHYPFQTAEIITNKKPPGSAHIATTHENTTEKIKATVLSGTNPAKRLFSRITSNASRNLVLVSWRLFDGWNMLITGNVQNIDLIGNAFFRRGEWRYAVVYRSLQTHSRLYDFVIHCRYSAAKTFEPSTFTVPKWLFCMQFQSNSSSFPICLKNKETL